MMRKQQEEKVLKIHKVPHVPEKLLLAMVAVFSCASAVGGENYIYWPYISHLPKRTATDCVY